MSKTILILAMAIFLIIRSWAHCEIPCGIYDDDTRLKSILENAMTIEKSMTKINSEKENNQIIRWVNNKEEHATKIQNIVSQYFLTQRIKKDAKDYTKKLEILHQLLVASMKCKQTTDVKYVNEIRTLVNTFTHLYSSATHK